MSRIAKMQDQKTLNLPGTAKEGIDRWRFQGIKTSHL